MVLSSTRQIEISGFLWAQKNFSPESFSRLEPVSFLLWCVAMRARGTRRRGCATDAHGIKCAWCKHMRDFDHACTWKPRGQQDKFVSAADVSAACFGHMVASVWDGSVVRRYNKYCLKRCLAMSVSERGSGEDAPPQHAWAAALLDACKLEELPNNPAGNQNRAMGQLQTVRHPSAVSGGMALPGPRHFPKQKAY